MYVQYSIGSRGAAGSTGGIWKNVVALNNRAIFEIPEILAGLLGETGKTDEKCDGSK